ncbi:lanthionine synthetase C family protein [Sphaerimonospora mesophila]|uniref:lanthionine synthetase C family protein n=1 Tax=Sphaerimonospora mesophila TaxID=37483 RepID=UPI0006E2785C
MSTSTATLTIEDATRQSLATGTAGTALLHIEKALTGSTDWVIAHAHVRQAVAGPIDAGAHAGLYYGAPAIGFMLHAASSGGCSRYRSAATALDASVLRLARRRVALATARMERGESATFGEYDLFYGLTGIGALLLHRMPGSDTLADILRYLICLTRPRHDDGIDLPGWWVAHDPDPILPTPGGHANFGIAHGAAGLLALLALAASRGCLIDAQHEAIEDLCAWFDRWQQDSSVGPWWPQWVTCEELRTGRLACTSPGWPSWCYGAVGIARALQLAGIATGDPRRRMAAEDAMAACLTDQQLDRITEAGLCHGMAGVYQTAYRAAQDAHNPAIGQRLLAVAEALTRHAAAQHRKTGQHSKTAQDRRAGQSGLLTGDAGVALALETMRQSKPPRSGWDACLLIT